MKFPFNLFTGMTVFGLLLGIILAQSPQPVVRVTRPTVDQLRASSGAASAVYVVDASGSIRFASIGSGLVLNCAPSGCSIEARNKEAVLPRRLETLSVATPTLSTHTLASPWTSELDVVRNGLELTEGVDYSVSGQVITFVPAAAPQFGDNVRIKYR